MTRGVPKDMAAKAQEQFDKQKAKVDRMLDKRQALMDQVVAINKDLEGELTLMQYYSQHPLVNTKTDDEPLPLEFDTPESVDAKFKHVKKVLAEVQDR